MQDHCSRSPVGDGQLPGVQAPRAVVVTGQHRDAIHPELLTALTRLSDVLMLAERGDYADARRTAADMRSVMSLLDHLGWDPEESSDRFEIPMERAELARAVVFLQGVTASALCAEIEDAQEASRAYGGSLRALTTYGAILAQLDTAPVP